jgi:hypothetical protein
MKATPLTPDEYGKYTQKGTGRVIQFDVHKTYNGKLLQLGFRMFRNFFSLFLHLCHLVSVYFQSPSPSAITKYNWSEGIENTTVI